jgi:hypothetical protein
MLLICFCRTTLISPPICGPEDDTELSPRLRTLALELPQAVVNVREEPLRVVVKRATARKDLYTPKGLLVRSHLILLMVGI